MGSTENKNIEANHNNIINIIILGNRYCGKTSFLNKYLNNEFNSEYNPTPYTNYYFKFFNFNDIQHKIQIWEISGNDKKKGKKSQTFANNSDGAIVLCDASNNKTRLE